MTRTRHPMPHRTDLRIIETMLGPSFYIVGPKWSDASSTPFLPVFPEFPFIGTDKPADANRELARLQELEDRSVMGWDHG